MVTCNKCGETFSNKKIYANHVRWKHKDNTEYFKNASNGGKKAAEKRFGKLIKEEVNCNRCNSSIEIEYRDGKKKAKYFCSRSCANSRGKRSNATKKKISNGVKAAWKNGMFDDAAFSNNKIFSSKGEREVVQYFKSKFKEDEWKSGGLMKIGESTFISRDMWSDKLKVCFEYDGIWHFKDINGQLSTKQHKDSLLEEWCLRNEYRLIRVEDGFSDLEMIEALIYHDKRPIIKIGPSY